MFPMLRGMLSINIWCLAMLFLPMLWNLCCRQRHVIMPRRRLRFRPMLSTYALGSKRSARGLLLPVSGRLAYALGYAPGLKQAHKLNRDSRISTWKITRSNRSCVSSPLNSRRCTDRTTDASSALSGGCLEKTGHAKSTPANLVDFLCSGVCSAYIYIYIYIYMCDFAHMFLPML